MRGKFAIAVLLAAMGLASCPSGYDLLPEPDAEHWLRFAQITDIHILDEESPGRAVRMEKFLPASWRPHEAYTTQVLDATLQAINRRHYAGMASSRGPIDFVLATGDVTDNAQYNELRWFIDVMDGKRIVPDSGALDGPLLNVPDEDNPNLPFEAFGLAKDIPWYVAVGNHDNESQGNFTIRRSAEDPVNWTSPQVSTAAGLLGLSSLEPPQTALSPTSDQSPAVILASEPAPINPDTFQLLADQVKSGSIPPDPNRHYISRRIFIHEHFNTTSVPLGHGFTFTNEALGLARYSVRPKLEVPVRLIVLDTAGPDALEGVVAAGGAFTVEQFENFLKPEVKAAQDAGEFVIVVTHHPPDQWSKPVAEATITGEAFRAYLASQPNVILNLCGHMHYNKVTLIPGRYPYYEILTSSLIEYPQEGRLIDVYYDRPGKRIILQSQLFCHNEAPTRLSAESYRRCNVDFLEDPLDYDYTDHVAANPPVFDTYETKSYTRHEETPDDRDFTLSLPRPDFP